MPTTTFRRDVRVAIKATLDAYVEANSADEDSLQAAFSRRPKSFGDMPCAYIGAFQEDIRSDLATRDRVLRVPVCLIDDLQDDDERVVDGVIADRMDLLVDAMLDVFQAAMRSLPNYSPLKVVAVEGDELPAETGAPYRREILWLQAETQEGSGL